VTGPNHDGIHGRTGCAIKGGNDLEKAEKVFILRVL